MSAKDPETVFRRLMEEGFNQGRLEVVDELFAPNSVEHQVRRPGHPQHGPQGAKEVINSLRSSFPDLHFTIEDLIVAGDRVWARMKARGTNLGPLNGSPPTGRSFEIDVIDIVRVADGRVVEHWGVPDRLGQMMQLGVWPPPPSAAGHATRSQADDQRAPG